MRTHSIAHGGVFSDVRLWVNRTKVQRLKQSAFAFARVGREFVFVENLLFLNHSKKVPKIWSKESHCKIDEYQSCATEVTLS